MHTASAYEDYWCPAADPSELPSLPTVNANDWIALLRISSGDWSIPSDELACLLERRLVEINAGVVRLTHEGFVALGMPV